MASDGVSDQAHAPAEQAAAVLGSVLPALLERGISHATDEVRGLCTKAAALPSMQVLTTAPFLSPQVRGLCTKAAALPSMQVLTTAPFLYPPGAWALHEAAASAL